METNTNGNTALAKVTPMPIAEYSQDDFVRWQIVGTDITRDEFSYFLEVAKHLDLDPLRKQIYCVKRGTKAVVQTGIDGYRVIAARTGQLAGIDDVEYGPEQQGHPTTAKVTIWRMVHGQRCPFTATARWAEYAQKTGKGELMPNWRNMPYLMLGKCAEALALRKAFPEALSGLYTDAEMGRPHLEVEAISLSQPQKPIRPAALPEGQEPPFAPPAGKTWPVWCAELSKQLGIFDTKDEYLAFVKEITGVDPNLKKIPDAGWQKLAHHLLNEIDLVEGQKEEDAGLAKMAGLDEVEAEAAE